MKERLLQHHSSHVLHSADVARHILPVGEIRMVGMEWRALSVVAPSLWNSLVWAATTDILPVGTKKTQSFWGGLLTDVFIGYLAHTVGV